MLVSLLLSSSLWAQGNEDPASQEPGRGVPPPEVAEAALIQTDPLKRLLADLGQPGPEAARTRSDAIDALLARAEVEYVRAAIEFVWARILNEADPDGTATELLARLDRAARSEHHVVYGRSDPESRSLALAAWGECLLAIVGNYELSIRRIGEDSPTTNREPMSEWTAAAVGLLRDLDPAARRSLVESEGLAGGDRLRNALRASGHLRDLGLVSWLGSHFDDPAVANDARYALSRLTFSAAEFESRAAVEEWVRQNASVRYVDLAERAIARYRAELRSQGSLADQRVADQAALFVDALASANPPRWSRLQSAIESSQNLAVRSAVRGQLAETLTRRLSSGEGLGSFGPGRQAFGDYIDRFLGDAETVGHPDWIRVAGAVADPNDPGHSQALDARLARILESGDEAQRIAGLQAQRRFPSVEARARVLRTASRAVAESSEPVLLAAVKCLLAPGWSAPNDVADDRQQWVDLMSSLLIGAGISEDLRQLAVDAASLRDDSSVLVESVLEPLGNLAKDASAPVGLRVLATAKMSAFLGLPSVASTVLETAAELALDPEIAIRRALGQQWGSYLRNERLFERAIEVAEQTLRSETRLRVATTWIESLRGFPADHPEVGKAVAVLVSVAEVVGSDSASDPRRVPLIEALRTLSIDPARGADQWLVAVDGLVRLGARQALLGVLPQRGISNLLTDKSSDRTAAVEILFEVARLWQPGEVPASLAKWLVEATLDGRPEARSLQDQLLALDARLVLERYEEAQAMVQGLETVEGVADNRELLATEQARIAFGRGEAEAGFELLRGLGDLSGVAASDAFRRAAEATEGKESIPWAHKAYLALPDDLPLWRERFLDYWDRKVNFDANNAQDLEVLRANGSAFDQKPEAERYQRILAELETTIGRDGGGI
ncbi:MAG: hypothetical protein AAF196_04525 [Planctomycetota bacterium]